MPLESTTLNGSYVNTTLRSYSGYRLIVMNMPNTKNGVVCTRVRVIAP